MVLWEFVCAPCVIHPTSTIMSAFAHRDPSGSLLIQGAFVNDKSNPTTRKTSARNSRLRHTERSCVDPGLLVPGRRQSGRQGSCGGAEVFRDRTADRLGEGAGRRSA